MLEFEKFNNSEMSIDDLVSDYPHKIYWKKPPSLNKCETQSFTVI